MEFVNQLDEELSSALRPYQKDALLTIYQYLSSGSEQQALIKMPMGTGKSTIIAVTSSYLTSEQSTIVVTATKAVKDQLLKDITEEVWGKMGITKRPTKNVCEIKPSSLTSLPDIPTVYVTTIQALIILKDRRNDIFQSLQSKIDLVIFDEGHKEPASNWQSIIRSFGKKVLLFTATPVRNDNNKFQIDTNYTYTYSYQEAKDQNYVRDLEFEFFEYGNDITGFVEYIYTRFQEYILQEGLNTSNVKCIIRCGNADEIRAIVEELKDKSTVIGIHDRFSDGENSLLKNQVPEDVRTSDIIFWVHQNKLIEGIDDYQFSLLGIYESLPDPRSLIQQIGRVLRKGEDSRKAIVLLSDNESHQMDWWYSYTEYERLISLNPEDIVFRYNNYFSRVKEANPSTAYLNKKFLKRFSVDSDQEVEDKLKKYQIPKKANIYEAIEDIDDIHPAVDTMLQEITEEFARMDILVLDQFKVEHKQIGCILYSVYENSNVLVNESFLEIKLGLTIFCIIENKLYYFDSNQYIPSTIYENWKTVNAVKLKRVFSSDSQFSSMTIQNGSINFNSFNRMIVDSQDVSNMVPDVTDKFNLCTTLVGSRKKRSGIPSLRSYVGFSNARISQGTNPVTLTSYLDWIEDIDRTINNLPYQEHEIFQRFAPVSDIPATVTPVSILFQIDYEKDQLKTSYGTSTELDRIFYKIDNSKFTLEWDGNPYELEIKFSSKKAKYTLELTDPIAQPNVYVINKNKKKMSLLEWLNQEQAFQIIVKGNTHRYFMGNFYKVGVPSDYNWLINIFDENELILPARKKKVNEKGKLDPKTWKTMWDPNSLFSLVAQKGTNIRNDSKLKGLLTSTDYLICTDLQTEIADFITISESTDTVCFIHCKAGDSKLSASAFQEVCGQIVKNLDYVNKGSERKPYNIPNWDGDWIHKRYKVSINRKIHNPRNLSAEEIWRKLKDIQNKPESKTYVIALMGDAFSKSSYAAQKRKKFEKQKPEVIQIDYILNQIALAVERAQAEFILAFNKL
ncbi:DEAD/DEAH box helicase family protein [Cytobacillus firmus]|nr:DEAD/DEAH box helicase family protein [Cytobacillus firmus]